MKYDRLYINGKIFTSDDNRPYAEAMAVKDGRICWVGSDAEAEAAGIAADSAGIIDFGAKRVLPGFVDCHMHAIMLADFARQISVLPPEIYSIEDLKAAIRRVRNEQEEGQWILGWGYDEGKLSENRAPNRRDLDEACSDSPVLMQRSCTHIWAVNSKALELAGITKDTPDPEGGRIGRDENGEPDGILYETATYLVMKLLPQKTVEDMADDLVNLGNILNAQGVTTVTDMGEDVCDKYGEIFRSAMKKGFKNRAAAYCSWRFVQQQGGSVVTDDSDFMSDGRFRLVGVKLIGDGSVSGRTAWCDVPYLPVGGASGEPEYGMPVCAEEDIKEALDFCKKNKCQLSIHCMGARTIDRAVDLTWQEQPWMKDGQIPSVRLEHVAMPTPQAVKRSAEAGIAWATQPIFLYSEIESYQKNMPPERVGENYNIADWQEAGVRFAFSTDAPATSWATPSEPFANLKGAVTRKAWNGEDTGQRHRVDVETAIKLYTREAGPVAGFSDVGMLKEGYVADFIVLDRDILEMAAEKIDQVRVDETWIGGEKVYER
ncbi:MAG: amidohydrolase [Firmicutes bacterium]|nr:amidohydrolase [Bacillota bacterium]